MAVKLHHAFLERMRKLLNEEFDAFVASYDEPRLFGLRRNPLKISRERFLGTVPFELAPVPWAEEGYYYGEDRRPGKHPFYHAGLYYIQEPSAMIPAELAEAKPGDRILDLCAAPGGKTTQLAGKLGPIGLLVANDNHGERVKALAKNVELFGIRNAVVTNEEPERLAAKWPGWFTKILIDAPCSGEGMFRKEEDMVRSWEKHSVEKSAAMQRDILRHAADMLAPGGRIVYSTCTFAPEENECVIAEFLASRPDFRVVPVPAVNGFAQGRPDWIPPGPEAEKHPEAALATAGTVRLWPHKAKGEGHFAAVLEKLPGIVESADHPVASGTGSGEETGRAMSFAASSAAEPSYRASGKSRAKKRDKGAFLKADDARAAAPDPGPWLLFQKELLTFVPEGELVCYGEALYIAPHGSPPLDALKVARPGWHVGALKRGRFEPSHALAMGLQRDECRRTLTLPSGSEELIRYLKGETLSVSLEQIRCKDGIPAKGYVLVCADEWPVGWGKWADGMLKNEYPPSWRWI